MITQHSPLVVHAVMKLGECGPLSSWVKFSIALLSTLHANCHFTPKLTPDLAGVFLLEMIDGLGSEEEEGRGRGEEREGGGRRGWGGGGGGG